MIREQELNTDFHFLKPFGCPRHIPAKIRDIPPKSLVFLGFEGNTELFDPPPPSRGRPPTHRKISGPKCLGLCSVFMPEHRTRKIPAYIMKHSVFFGPSRPDNAHTHTYILFFAFCPHFAMVAEVQKTREGCGCFLGLCGSSAGKFRESSGKIAGKIFPNREMLQILGFRAPGKANLPGTLGPHCRDVVPTFRAGCFLKSTVPAFSSFF